MISDRFDTPLAGLTPVLAIEYMDHTWAFYTPPRQVHPWQTIFYWSQYTPWEANTPQMFLRQNAPANCQRYTPWETHPSLESDIPPQGFL